MARDEFVSLSPSIRGILMLMWASMGIVYTLPGPTLLFLSCRTNTGISSLVPVFLGRSLGALGGGFVVTIATRYSSGLSPMFCGLIIISIATSLIPFITTFDLMAVVMLFSGLGFGASWKASDSISKSSEWKRINIQNLLYSTGALVAPLFTVQFLRKQVGVRGSDFRFGEDRNKSTGTLIPLTCSGHTPEVAGIYLTGSIPLYMLIIVTLAALLYRIHCPNSTENSSIQGNTKEESRIWNVAYCSYFTTVNFMLSGIESIITTLVVLHAVLYGMPMSKALLINSAFWIAYSAGCCLVAILSPCIPLQKLDQYMASAKILGLVVGAVVMTTSAKMTWLLVGLLIVGLSLPCVMENVTSSNDGYSMWVQNKHKLCFISRLVAEALGPYFTVLLMERAGTRSFLATILILSLILLSGHFVFSLVGIRRQRDLQLSQYQDIELDYRFERKEIRQKMRQEVNTLLGDPYDDLSYYTSEDEILFDKTCTKR